MVVFDEGVGCMKSRERGFRVPGFGVLVAFSCCWDPCLWHFKSKSGSNWILFGLFLNPSLEGDVWVVFGVLGPFMVKVGW